MWLLEQKTRDAMHNAITLGVKPTAEEQAKFEARVSSSLDSGESRVLTVAGNTAEIAVNGVLTKTPSFMAMLFGGGNTTYSEIINALAQADASDTIEKIVLAVDSPGGEFDGMFNTIAALQATKKPIEARVNGLAASAAYALVSQANTITATSRADRIGSVGVVATIGVHDDEIQITSTNAPRKRPDVTTDEGIAMVREELDAMHEIFVDAIATGRNTTVAKVNSDFGQGGTLLAGDALNRGMIDAIAEPKFGVVKSSNNSTTASMSGIKPEANNMDLKTLIAQHPDVYAAAVKEGETKERDRVEAHLTMGNASGDMKTAIDAINDGSEMTAKLQATYLAAGMNRQDLENRQDDDNSANSGDAPLTAEESTELDAKVSNDILLAAANSLHVEVEV